MKSLYYILIFVFLCSGTTWAQLSGDRNVPSADYPDLASVADSLNSYGVGSGGVNFILQDGSTYEELTIEFTASGTADNPVYIGWDGLGVKPVVNFEGTAAAGDAGFMLNGVDYYTLDGIEITNTNSNLETGILLVNQSVQNGASDNTVSNTDITLDKLNAFETAGISVLALDEPTQFEGNNHNNKFYNNSISNVLIGYTFDGGTSTTNLMSVGNEVGIQANGESIISDIVMAGVTARDQNGFIFSNTIIRDLTRIGDGTIAPAAIATSSGNPSAALTNPFIISHNTIEDMTSSYTSIFGMYLSARKVTYHVNNNKVDNITATGGDSNTADGIMLIATDAIGNIYNNMVSGIAAPASAVSNNGASRGITVRTFEQANVFYNTVVLDFEATNPAHQSAAFVIYNNNDAVQWRNNIFINKSTLPADATGFIAAVFKRNNTFESIMSATDDNIYYAGLPGPQNVIYWGNNSSTPNIQETIAEYIAAASTFEQNSASEDVEFAGADDLHLAAASVSVAIDNAADVTTPIAITTDFDGSPREAGISDIGADEMSIVMPTVPAAAITPSPSDTETGVSLVLADLSWEYLTNDEFATPATYEVYFSETALLDDATLIATVDWVDGVSSYSTPAPVLDSETLYYWKVVPLTADDIAPEIVLDWTFTTEMFVFGYPNPAENPTPIDNAEIDLLVGNTLSLAWDYNAISTHSLPSHFEVYGSNDAGSTDWDTAIGEVDYIEGQVAYEMDVTNHANFSFVDGDDNFWKIVPVSATDESATDVLDWMFTFDESIGVDELATDATALYPNPAIDYVYVEPGFSGAYEVIVYDMQGRFIQSSVANQGLSSIDVSAMQSGAYQVVLRQGELQSMRMINVE